MRIRDNVFCVAAPFGGGGLVHCYLVDAPRKTLIDTGTASVPKESLLPALRELGWDLSDLRYIINTHMHGDHAGGNAEMKELSGAEIHMHRADTDRIDPHAYVHAMQEDQQLLGQPPDPQAEARVMEQLGNAWGVDRVLDDGDVVDLGGDVRLNVLHTPGHTAGSTCFYWESAQTVFSGDAVGGRGSRVNGYPLYSYANDYRESLRRLLDLPDIAYLMQAHRYRWSGTDTPAVRQNGDVRQTLEESVAVWRAIDDTVRNVLEENSAIEFKDLFARVVRQVAPALGNDPEFEGMPSGALATIAAHWREQRSLA